MPRFEQSLLDSNCRQTLESGDRRQPRDGSLTGLSWPTGDPIRAKQEGESEEGSSVPTILKG